MRSLSLFVFAGIAIAFAVATTASGQEQGPLAAPPVTANAPNGHDLFIGHCAICHGLDGRGQGPLAEAMKIVPADLTQIAAKHDGTFPDAKMSDVIRNGGAVLGHGSRAMLPWGLYFSERHKPATGKARIKALVEYLKSLQQPSLTP
ncbi:MAG: c-type cytochrome [Hyphomicrobium sp.]|jgi:mono/diheme cytochrome c family protein